MRESGLQAKPVFNGLIHFVKGALLLASRGNRVYRSQNEGRTWELLCTVPCGAGWQMKAATSLGRRLFRAKIGHVLPVAGSHFLIFGFQKIYVYDAADCRFIDNPAELVGSRPLSLCQVSSKEVFYGQYCNNRHRRPVAVLATEDGGLRWREAYRFQNVRHIHGVFQDPCSSDIWITTGDDDSESAIWVTRDRFQSVEQVVFGSQQTRAVDLVFSDSHVYFGSDTPREQNWLQRLDRRTGNVERLQAVESSVFYGGRCGDWILFSTACEPSQVNGSAAASIWGSRNGTTWRRLLTFRKDVWPCKYFEHGQVRFPHGLSQASRLWFSPLAVQRHEQVLTCALPEQAGQSEPLASAAEDSSVHTSMKKAG